MEDNYTYPIYTLDNTCMHCGSRGSLYRTAVGGGRLSHRSFFDRGENVKEDNSTPFYGYKCNNCGREYFIGWVNDFGTPVPVSKTEMKKFGERFKGDDFEVVSD